MEMKDDVDLLIKSQEKKHVQNSENNKNVFQNVEMVFCYQNSSSDREKL